VARDEADRRLEAELRDHVERQVVDYLAQGIPEAEARRRARLETGGLEQAKEECRDVRPGNTADQLRRDIHVGFRSLLREPLFTIAVMAILSVGIGASAAMFSVLNTVVLRPLPYARPGELVFLTTHLMRENRPDGSSVPNLTDWRVQSRTLSGLTFYRRTSVSLATFDVGGTPQRVEEGLVGPEFFDLLGTPPLVGRTFSRPEFDRSERVVVLSEGLWQELFGGSRDVTNRTMTIGGETHTILGVMPRTFQLPSKETKFWRPLSTQAYWIPNTTEPARGGDGFEVIGRLARGGSVDAIQAEMRVIAARLRDAHPANANMDVRVMSLADYVLSSGTRRAVWLGFAAVLSLLAIACANAGGLLSVRAARRRHEFVVRSALGAGRARLVRQLLAESVSIWAVASGGGLLLAFALVRLMRAYGPQTVPRIEQLALDPIAVAGALLAGLIVVTLCGTIPAVLAARVDPAQTLAVRDHAGLPRQRVQQWLVGGQIAVAVMLLVGAVLFARSFSRAQNEDPGYPADDLLIVRINLPQPKYANNRAAGAFILEAQERILRLPGVVAIGGITDFFIRRNADQQVAVLGAPVEREENRPRLTFDAVTPGFFHAVGMELLEGRDFGEEDFRPDSGNVFIVTESVARRFWPGESAIGKRMSSGGPPEDGVWNVVVGVVNDMRREGLDVEPVQTIFYPTYQRGMDLAIRTSTPPEGLAAAIRGQFQAIDPALPIMQIATAGDRLSQRLSGRRFDTQVFSAFAGIAMLLSAAGLYALLAYQVAIQRREIAVRAAIGASRRLIVLMVLRKGIRVAVVAVAGGVVGALLVSGLLQGLLYQTAAVDPASYAVVAVFVLAVAALAAAMPAARAARVSPMTALRED
jgi:predicted permease